MNINGKATIYGKSNKNGKVNTITRIATLDKKVNEWVSAFVDIWVKDLEMNDGEKKEIQILDGFITTYKTTNGESKLKFCVTKYIQL